jgi:uncharacterized SAM-binding protein YcdF (DUF218 family)
MNEICSVFKAILDPLFIVFVLLLISLVVFLLNCKKKGDSLIIVLCIILVFGAGIAPVSNYLCLYLEKDYIKNTSDGVNKNIDAIVVLGAGTKEIKSLKETFSNETGYLRVLHAVEVYNKIQPGYFVTTGKGEGDISEAQTLAKLAEALGVPKEKIRMESNSTNTGENAGEVNKIFDSRKVKIGLVTSAFHMKRSEREFKKYFDHVTPLPAHYLYSSPTGNIVVRYMPQSGELYKTSIALKEIIAQLWYIIK